MKNINFKNIEDLNKYIDIHKIKILGSGIEGTCYLLDIGLVMKVLFKEVNLSNELQFKDINNSSFIFTKNIGLIDGKVKSLYMDYAEGCNLKKHIPVEQKITTIGEQLQVLVDDIKEISKLGILVRDFHSENVIYNNNFKIIDTNNYTIEDKNTESTNIREIMTSIYGSFLYQIIRYEEIKREFRNYGKLELFENPLKYSEQLKELICNLTDENIETVNEANKVLQKNFKPSGVSKRNK